MLICEGENREKSLDMAVLGISHQTAPIEVREAFALVCHRLFKNSPEKILAGPSVLISTCNRCEIYLPALGSHLLDALQALETSELKEDWKLHLYIHKHEEAFSHLCKVISGVESVFFGETQIQSQVKAAYKKASEVGLSSDLHLGFQKALQLSKRVREELDLSGTRVSLESHLYSYAKDARSILFVGASAINEDLLHYFLRSLANKNSITLVKRSDSQRAQRLAKLESFKILPWESLVSWPKYEIVIVATTSPHYLEAFKEAPPEPLSTRHIFDLSVPCNVNPTLAKLNLTLHNIDSLKQAVAEKMSDLNSIKQKALNLLSNLCTQKSKLLERKIAKRKEMAATLLKAI